MTRPAAAPAAADRPVPPAVLWWALLAAAFALRAAAAWHLPRQILFPDGMEYEAVARHLLAHGNYGLQTLRPPGYPTLIAAVYALFGPNLLALRLVEAALGTLAVGVLGAVGHRLLGPRAALVTMVLAAFSPLLVLLPATQYSENTLLLLLALAQGGLFLAWRGRGLAGWALAGVLLGLVLLVRPNLVLVLPGLALGFGLLLARARRAWLAPAAVCGLAAALTVTPWIARNHRVHGHWYFIATGGGRQFWSANNPRADAKSDRLVLPDSILQGELALLPDDVSRERHLYRRGLDFVRGNPRRAATLYALELRNLFSLYPVTLTRVAFVGPGVRLAQSFVSLAVFLGALLAMRGLRRTPPLWPMVGGIASFALGQALFFTVMRYRVAIEPLLLWMAGWGWSTLWSGTGHRAGAADAGGGR